MPNYEYQCNSCDEEFELRRKRKDPSPVVCPACGKEDCKKLISASSFHLKGGGWFDEGYGLQPSSTKSEKKKTDSEETSSKDEKTPSKSAEKSESKSAKTKEKSSTKTQTKSKTKNDD